MLTMIKNCPNCGTENTLDASFCIVCGYNLESIIAVDKQQLESYQLGLKWFSEGKLEEALAIFSELRGFQDSDEKYELINKIKLEEEAVTRESNYSQATELFATGNLDAALVIFKQLGNYKDAQDKVTLIEKIQLEELVSKQEGLYEQAIQLVNEGQLAQAKEIFFRISTYRDSNDKLRIVTQMLAELNEKNKETLVNEMRAIANETQEVDEIGKAIGILQANGVSEEQLDTVISRYNALEELENKNKKDNRHYIISLGLSILMVLIIGGGIYGLENHRLSQETEATEKIEKERRANSKPLEDIDKKVASTTKKFVNEYEGNVKDYQFDEVSAIDDKPLISYTFIGEDEALDVLPKNGSRILDDVVFTENLEIEEE